MRVLTLSLEQFRSFPSREFDFSENLAHVLLGENGVGKTNILESLSLLSLGKSFLKADETSLVHWGEEYYRLRACLKNDAGDERTIELVSQLKPRKAKACFINDVKMNVADAIGVLPTVTFLPQDLDLFTGSPSARRSFLDRLLCQVSPEFVKRSASYGNILRQRNACLKKIAQGIVEKRDLTVWNEMLCSQGAFITVKRLELIELLQCTLPQELSGLCEDWSDAKLQYARKGRAASLDDIEEEMLQLLASNIDRDVILQSTSVGPHRDDWSMLVSGRPIETFASRGQQRTALLALLFLTVSYLELRRGEKPIILLDDVFSELDDAHQSALLASLKDHQVLLSTTHIPRELHGAKVWEMSKNVELRM